MPKRRHHQQHRRRGVPSTGLQLPQIVPSDIPGQHRMRYPDRWIPRSARPLRFVLIYAGAALAIVVFFSAVAVLMTLFTGR